MRRRAVAVLAGGLVALLAAVALVLSGTGYRTLDSNHVGFDQFVAEIPGGQEACQGGETFPAGTGRLELTIADRNLPTPPVTFALRTGDRVLARGRLQPGWPEGRLTVPLDRVITETVRNGTWCVANRGSVPVLLAGQPGDSPSFNAVIGDATAQGRMRVNFLTRDRVSWWSQVDAIVDRFGLGKAQSFSGSWPLWVAGLLVLISWGLAARVVLRGANGRGRRAAAVAAIGLVGTLNALAWSLITPPWHVPDELAHFSYAEVLMETGKLPRDQPGAALAPDLDASIGALRFFATVGNPDNKPIRTDAEQRRLREVEAAESPSYSNGEALVAASQPPLYYAVVGVPYEASPSVEVLDRLQLMRFVSALIAGLTAVFAALFVAELLPRSRWAWAGAGVAVAFQPMVGFMGGGVNGDNLLYAASAALFFAVARMLRRGLTLRTGALVGAVVAVGALTKLTFHALVPMAALAVLIALWQARGRPRDALPGAAAAGLLAGVPYLLYRVFESAWRVAPAGPPDPVAVGTHLPRELLSYTWQLYLPRMPWMTDLIPEVPPYNLWFVGIVGRFGWLDYSFPGWVNQIALVVFAGIVALAAVGLWRCRSALRARLPELVVYAAGVAVLLVVIGFVGYHAFKDQGQRFEQARYLLPLLALLGAVFGVALRALGPRWGVVGAAALVVLAAGHSLMAQLLTLARYYG